MENSLGEILLVDDDPLTIAVLTQYLTKAGYRVDSAENGAIALKKLMDAPQRFTLIILDRVMPVMSGIDLLHKILLCEALQPIPIIMLTVHAEREDRGAAVIAGIYDFLFKPVEPDLLLMVVKRALVEKKFKEKHKKAS